MCDFGQVAARLRQAEGALEAAKADNVALLERLKFVQGYQTRSKGTRPAMQ
jgi:hypothetical protein